MSANSGLLIIVCAAASAVIVVASFLHEKISAFNRKHRIITCSDSIVRPVVWNGGLDGVDEDGVPFYGSMEDEDSEANMVKVKTIHSAEKKVKEYGESRNHAA